MVVKQITLYSKTRANIINFDYEQISLKEFFELCFFLFEKDSNIYEIEVKSDIDKYHIKRSIDY